MASSNAEILARLTLNAEQFSSEMGKRFAQVKDASERAAGHVKRPFLEAFSEVQKLAQTAVAMPRTAGGNLSLAGEIGALTASARAADARAQALREMAAAQDAASARVSQGAEALRLEADAARTAALVEEQSAKASRDRVVALQAVQAELNRTHSAVVINTGAANDNAEGQRKMRMAMQQVSYSAQDVFTQVSMGGNVLQTLTVQGMQAAGAFTHVGGRAEMFANILMGPWGLAISAGMLLLAPFVQELIDGGDASDKLSGKTLSLVDALERERAGTDAARKALIEYNEEKKRARDQNAQATEATLASARARLQEAIATRQQIRAEIERQMARFGPGSGQDPNAALGALSGLEIQLRQQTADVNTLGEAYRNLNIEVANTAAKAAVDPVEGIRQKYGRLRTELERTAGAAGNLTQRMTDLGRRERAEIEAEQERQRKANRRTRTPALGDQLETERGQRLLATAQGYLGAREDTAAGRSTLGALFREANVSVDPKMTAWCAAFVNAVLATNGLPGTGSLSARSFLGYGSSTDKPEKGDIVVLRRGDNAAQGHVGFYAGAGRNGNVLVTGGNQGDSVSTQSFRRSDVLGFRRAPSAADAFADEEKQRAEADRDRERAAKELDASLKGLTATFDPAQAAVDKYRDTLQDISKLAQAGKINPVQAGDWAEAARREMRSSVNRVVEDRRRTDVGEDFFAKGLAEYDRMIEGFERRGDDRWAERERQIAQAGEAFERSIATAADLFGIRLTGPMQMMFGRGGVEGLAADMANEFSAVLRGTGIKLSREAEDKIASAAAGAAYGQIGGSAFASLTGGKNNVLASSIGGVLGNEAGKALGSVVSKEIGGQLGKTLGGAAGPLGSIVGGVLGSVVGSLFQKAPKGQAGVTVNQYGSVAAGAATGTDAQATAGASTLAGSVSAGLNRIAEMLGAKVTGATDVQIGVYKDMLRVNTSGGAIGGVKGSGALTFQTEEAAIAYAISDALKDGVLSGISDASLKILRSGQDLEKAIGKAVMIEQLPKQLKAALDPTGAAIDAVREKFAKLVAALDEGGASAEQRAQAEQLYNIELEQAKASAPAASQALKDFLEGMKAGSNSPLSLREQEKAARAALNPYLAAIDAGQTIDQGKFQQAAQSFLDVNRQLFGSTRMYFEAFDAVQAATNKAIAKIDNATPIASPSVPDPFTKATASAAEATAGAVKTGNEIAADQTDLLMRNNALLERIAAMMADGGGSDFIGATRAFA